MSSHLIPVPFKSKFETPNYPTHKYCREQLYKTRILLLITAP